MILASVANGIFQAFLLCELPLGALWVQSLVVACDDFQSVTLLSNWICPGCKWANGAFGVLRFVYVIRHPLATLSKEISHKHNVRIRGQHYLIRI